jgi:hypothetical protein
MLKPIVENQYVSAKLLVRIAPRAIAILANQHWHPGEGARQQIRFVSCCLPVEERAMAQRHDA